MIDVDDTKTINHSVHTDTKILNLDLSFEVFLCEPITMVGITKPHM